MATQSTIEWTETTWNPVTGCNKVSPGCKHCYAERMAKRLKAMGQPRYRNGFAVTLQDDLIQLPLRWKKPRLVFVNSMSDLFHKDVPDEFIAACFETMNQASQHSFQILTKRIERVVAMADLLAWGKNIWMGTSVESAEFQHRAETLAAVPAQIRFLSVEPLLGPVPKLPMEGLHWIIAGGESGPGVRPMEPDWVRSIRDQCQSKQVPFFFKQWGGVNKKATGRILDGRTWDEMPKST